MKDRVVPIHDRAGKLFTMWNEQQYRPYLEREDVRVTRDRKRNIQRIDFLAPGDRPAFKPGSYSGEGQSYSFEQSLGDGLYCWALKESRFMPASSFLQVMGSTGAELITCNR
jgi:hypothetical protein